MDRIDRITRRIAADAAGIDPLKVVEELGIADCSVSYVWKENGNVRADGTAVLRDDEQWLEKFRLFLVQNQYSEPSDCTVIHKRNQEWWRTPEWDLYETQKQWESKPRSGVRGDSLAIKLNGDNICWGVVNGKSY